MRLVVNWDQPVDLEFRLYHSNYLKLIMIMHSLNIVDFFLLFFLASLQKLWI